MINHYIKYQYTNIAAEGESTTYLYLVSMQLIEIVSITAALVAVLQVLSVEESIKNSHPSSPSIS